MTVRRLVLIGALAFTASLVVFAPASLLRGAIADVPGVALTGLSGTLWNGAARLVVGGVDLGALTFRLRPGDALRARFAYDVTVEGTDLSIDAIAAAAPGHYDVMLDGRVGASRLRDWLAAYDLTVPGVLSIKEVKLIGAWGARLPNATGEVNWTGGDVRYRLSGRPYQTQLPELSGFLDSSGGSPVLTVYEPGQPTPLMFLKIASDGLATAGITKQFTKLIGQPWASGEPDHAVVLEVGEKLF